MIVIATDWSDPQVVGVIVGAAIAGFTGVALAFLQHWLSGRRSTAAAEEETRREKIRVGSDVVLRSYTVGGVLADRPLHELGRVDDRRIVWASVRNDIDQLVRDAARIAMESDQGGDLYRAVAEMMRVWGEVLRYGYALCYGSVVDGVTVTNRYAAAVKQIPTASDAFSDAYSIEFGVEPRVDR